MPKYAKRVWVLYFGQTKKGWMSKKHVFLRLSHLFLSNGNEIDLHLVEGWKVRLYRGIIYQIVEIYYIILYIYIHFLKNTMICIYCTYIYIYIICIELYRY